MDRVSRTVIILCAIFIFIAVISVVEIEKNENDTTIRRVEVYDESGEMIHHIEGIFSYEYSQGSGGMSVSIIQDGKEIAKFATKSGTIICKEVE